MSNVSHVIPIVMLIHIWVWVNCSVIDTCDARACLFPPPYPCWHDTKYGSDPGERKRTCHQINRKSQEDSQTRGEATKNAIASALLPTAVVYVAHLTEGRSFSVRSYGGNFRFGWTSFPLDFVGMGFWEIWWVVLLVFCGCDIWCFNNIHGQSQTLVGGLLIFYEV